MANSAQARKRARQAENRRQHNNAQRSAYRTAMKKVTAAIEAGDAEAAKTSYAAAVPVMDRAAGRGLIAKNTISRYKSRLNTRIRSLA
ncbi:MAG: 30S ribosomal protein S20 [Immundisolibacteraceae bacterium]|nr:30S ribosomal protein S20 [Immundisolibacteraceae bacterium]